MATTPVNNLERSSLIAFAREKAAEERKWAKSRRDSAVGWETGTEADHESARLMAQRMSGRKMPKKTASDRTELAAIERRIALKHDAEAQVFDAIADLLAPPTSEGTPEGTP